MPLVMVGRCMPWRREKQNYKQTKYSIDFNSLRKKTSIILVAFRADERVKKEEVIA